MKLLFVNCCISQRGTGSRTHALAEAFLTAFQASHPGWETEEVTPETLLARIVQSRISLPVFEGDWPDYWALARWPA